MLIRYVNIYSKPNVVYKRWTKLKHVTYLALRFLMIIEMIYAFYIGKFWLWTIQYFLTTWWNMFLIVSSHDFEESESKAEITKD